ncbi:MAG: ABC transporter substrate-binding protein [Chitinispirillaceae bacterium]|nr:ABC transporter substrate-binding protein [Chitinispirillaceae bacterium]
MRRSCQGPVLALLVAFVASGCVQRQDQTPESAAAAHEYRRIVSLSPSITEILFALGLGDHVVGVTRFCLFPAEAKKKTVIGGYYDINYEALLRLHADLIVALDEHSRINSNINKLCSTVLVVDHTTVSGIVRSIRQIGERCGRAAAAARLADTIAKRMAAVEHKTDGLPRPRVLVSLGRGMASGPLADLYIAGQGTMYDELIRMAGGENVWSGSAGQYPQVSIEGVYALNPDIIIDMLPGLAAAGRTADEVRAEWDRAGQVTAVKNNRVYLFEQEYVTVPGPRIVLTLEAMARVIHPETAGE